MAQTRRKRKSKHRGNAAGIVEARGRTSRPTGDRKPAGRQSPSRGKAAARPTTAAERRAARFANEPTWTSSGKKAGIMAVLFAVILVVLGRSIPAALAVGALMTVLYLPLTYYTDRFFYNRHKRMQEKEKG